MNTIYQNVKKRKYLLFASGVIVFIFCMFFFLIGFFQQLRDNEIERCKDELIETSIKGTVILKNQLDSNTALLETSSGIISDLNETVNKEKLIMVLKDISDNSDFERVGISDEFGHALLSTGVETNISDKNYFRQSMAGNSYITNVFESKLKEDLKIFVISVPLYDGQSIQGILYGVIETQRLSESYNDTEMMSNRYFHIVDRDGDYILKSDHDNAIFTQNNLWEDLELFDFERGYSLSKMKSDFENGASGLVSYSKNGESRFCYYIPLGINGWYMLSCAPYESVYAYVTDMNRLIFNLGFKVLGCIGLFIALLYLFNLIQYKELHKRNEELLITSEILKIATNEMANGIFEYDIRSKTLHFKNDHYQIGGMCETMSNIPEAMIEQGIVCSESFDEFKKVFEKVRNGEAKASAEVCIFHGLNKRWERLTLTNVFNEQHEVIRTIGILEDITAEKEQELKILQEVEYRKAMMTDTVEHWEVNLSKDVTPIDGEGKSYSEGLLKYVRERIYKEDQRYILAQCSLNHLKSLFVSGKKDIKVEYRVELGNKGVRWYECSIHMLNALETDDILAYIFTRDIHEKKQKEIDLKYVAEHDVLTNLYNRAACEFYIDEFLSNDENALDLHAFIILDLDNFKEVNDQFGHGKGDQVLNDVAKILNRRFRKSDMIARLGGDEFIVFLKNINTIDNVKKHAQGLVEAMNLTYSLDGKSVSVSASIGIALALDSGRCFKQLYMKADRSLYHVKQKNKNGYEIYDESMMGDEDVYE